MGMWDLLSPERSTAVVGGRVVATLAALAKGYRDGQPKGGMRTAPVRSRATRKSLFRLLIAQATVFRPKEGTT